MRDGYTVTSPQPFEIPPLHTTLKTLANPEELSAGIIQETGR